MSKLFSNARLLYSLLRMPAGTIAAVTLCSVCVSSRAGTSQVIKPYSPARKYHQSDLMMIGNVISRVTRVLEVKDSLSAGECVCQYTSSISMDILTARVDTVLKGYYEDSIIVILSQPVAKVYTCEMELLNVEERNDSILETQVTPETTRERDRVSRRGKYILLIQKQGGCYIATYSRPYKESYSKISGRVADGVTGEPISSVAVIIPGTEMWAVTNEDGYYDILSVPPGRIYDVKVDMLGYHPSTQRDVRVIRKAGSAIDFFLRPSVFELQQ